ncbi:MAG: hypothetical protein ILO34_04350, partial [Kiritimatiellae bacterium]|nr:hypothetical protein [Kiritimatiellia bacterium]
TVSHDIKGHGKMNVSIGGDWFAGSIGDWHVQSADVGGNWTKDGAKVYVTATGLPAGTIEELLPAGEPVIPKGGKWSFAKAAGVKWAKDKATKAYALTVDTSKCKTNLSALKLTYTPKKGTFKGSFKMYSLEGEGKKTKLKKYTVSVTGMVVDGIGYGSASVKKPSIVCPVIIK